MKIDYNNLSARGWGRWLSTLGTIFVCAVILGAGVFIQTRVALHCSATAGRLSLESASIAVERQSFNEPEMKASGASGGVASVITQSAGGLFFQRVYL